MTASLTLEPTNPDLPTGGLVARRYGRLIRPLGWMAAGGAVIMGGLGWFFGWVELVIPAAGLAVAFILGLIMAIGKAAYRADLSVADQAVTVGEKAWGHVAVWNPTSRRLLPSRMVLPVGDNEFSFRLPFLKAGGTAREVFDVPTTCRAVVPIGPVRSSRGDPLGLIDRSVHWTEAVELFVHPKTIVLSGTTSGILRDLEGQATTETSDSDIAFHALREYVPGDDRRNIHWRSSAKLGALMVRQYQDTRRVHTALAVATATDQYRSPDDFELAMSVLASIGLQNLRDSRELTAFAGSARLRSDRAAPFLDACCPAQLAADGPGVAAVARQVSRSAPTATFVVLLTGGLPSRAELRGAAAFLPVGVRVLGLRCEVGSGPLVHTTGDISQGQVGSLEDLPRVLRRAVAG